MRGPGERRVAVSEAKVALVPRLLVPSGWRDREYALLLTDRRLLLVLERSVHRGVLTLALLAGLAVGGTVGILLDLSSTPFLLFTMGAGLLAAAAARAAMPRRVPDYEGSSTEAIAQRTGTVSVPYAALTRLEFVKPPRRPFHILRLAYAEAGGASRTIAGRLAPLVEWTRDRRAEGTRARAAYDGYARSARDAFQKALPAEVLARLAEAG